jgi:hypothetical protein
VDEQVLSEGSRAEALTVLIRSSQRLLLQPHDADARQALVVLLAAVPLTSGEDDSLLITALVKEASAHADELAFRLEAPGYSPLYIAATTARLCQTLTILQAQLAPNARREVPPAAA